MKLREKSFSMESFISNWPSMTCTQHNAINCWKERWTGARCSMLCACASVCLRLNHLSIYICGLVLSGRVFIIWNTHLNLYFISSSTYDSFYEKMSVKKHHIFFPCENGSNQIIRRKKNTFNHSKRFNGPKYEEQFRSKSVLKQQPKQT